MVKARLLLSISAPLRGPLERQHFTIQKSLMVNLSQGSFLTARLSLNRFQSSHEVSHPAWPPQRIKFSLRAIILKLNRSGVKVLSGKEIGQGMVQSRATQLWKALGHKEGPL